MTEAKIIIIGSLIACSEGMRDDWRDIANWLSDKLKIQYGSQVNVTYFDLFDSEVPALPADAKLPVIIINGSIFSMGEKISVMKIKKEIQSLGISPLERS